MKLRLIAGLLLAASAASAAPASTTSPAAKASASAPAHPLPQFSVDATAIDRDAPLRVSFAGVAKRAAQSVVYISSSKRVKTAPNDMNQLFNDPMFRRFFGPMMPNQGEGNGGGGGGNNGGGGRQQTQKQESLGSGVVVSANGYILTNNHVVEGADEIKVHMGESHKEYRAKVIGRDADVDVAVLKIDAGVLPAAVLGDSDQLQVGDTVLAIGDPFDIGMTVTHGIVSALGRNTLGIEALEDFIQTDAPINPGNSGGALLDIKGRVVGINTAILTHTGGSNGVGFAIPINLVRSIAEQLIRTGKVSRGMLGVSLQEITPDLADQFGSSSGALVNEVKPGMPAEKAGIQSGDIITKLNGKLIQDYRSLSLAVSQLAPGTVVQLEYLRSGKVMHATVTLADRANINADGNTSGNAGGANGNDTGVLNGVGVQDITPEIREELHLPATLHGAVITEVAPDSASALAGLQKGDVILDLDRKPVHNSQEAIRLSAEIKGPKVLVRFRRGSITQYVVVDESQSQSGGSSGAAPSADGGESGSDDPK